MYVIYIYAVLQYGKRYTAGRKGGFGPAGPYRYGSRWLQRARGSRLLILYFATLIRINNDLWIRAVHRPAPDMPCHETALNHGGGNWCPYGKAKATWVTCLPWPCAQIQYTVRAHTTVQRPKRGERRPRSLFREWAVFLLKIEKLPGPTRSPQ
jgi:hypothetical protein